MSSDYKTISSISVFNNFSTRQSLTFSLEPAKKAGWMSLNKDWELCSKFFWGFPAAVASSVVDFSSFSDALLFVPNVLDRYEVTWACRPKQAKDVLFFHIGSQQHVVALSTARRNRVPFYYTFSGDICIRYPSSHDCYGDSSVIYSIARHGHFKFPWGMSKKQRRHFSINWTRASLRYSPFIFGSICFAIFMHRTFLTQMTHA